MRTDRFMTKDNTYSWYSFKSDGLNVRAVRAGQ